jgi:peptide/nickel transport system permease protein
MLGVVIRRGFETVVVLFVLSLILFGLRNVMGDPIVTLLPSTASPEEIEAATRFYGLDKPLPQQYAIWVSHAVQGDMGKSLRSAQPALELIWDRLPASALLAGISVLISLVAGIGMGTAAAIYRRTPVATLISVTSVIGQTVPGFLVAILLIGVFSVSFGLLPSGGADTPQSYILPALSLATFPTAAITRLTRASMLEVLDSEYVKLARVKGVPEWLVIFKHALRNALGPVTTFSGMIFGILIGFVVVVEKVFAWPGIGSLTLNAATSRDYPLLQASVLVLALIVMAMNLTVDLLYRFLDPRIRV